MLISVQLFAMMLYFISLQVVMIAIIFPEQLSLESAVPHSTECHNSTSDIVLCQNSFPLNSSNSMIITLCTGLIEVHYEILIQNKTSLHLQSYGDGRTELLCNTSNKNIVIKSSLFSHNEALWGGGLRVHYLNSPQNNSIVVQNSQFINNSCFYNGGGIDLGFAAYYTQRQMGTWNEVRFQTCLVRENKAGQYGGGVRIFSSRNEFKAMRMIFSNCSLEDNEALYGPAIDMLPRSVDVFNDGYLSSISFNDCTFTSNRVIRSLVGNAAYHTFKHYESGKGVFACADFSLNFSGTTVFNQNNGSAMHLSSCRVQFQCESHVEFTDNTGYDGGAIVLFGASVLYVMDNSTFLFISNRAVRRGGAIMYFSSNEHDFIS